MTTWLQLIQLVVHLTTTAAAAAEPDIIDKFFQYQCSSSEGCPCETVCDHLVSACENMHLTKICMPKCSKAQRDLHDYRGMSISMDARTYSNGYAAMSTTTSTTYNYNSTTQCGTGASTPFTANCTLRCQICAGAIIGAVIMCVVLGALCIGVAYWRCRDRFRHDPASAEDGENQPLAQPAHKPTSASDQPTTSVAQPLQQNVQAYAELNNSQDQQLVGQMHNCDNSIELTALRQTVSTQTGSFSQFAERLKTFEVQGRGVFAVARLDSEIFLLQTEDDTILVYEASKPYRFIKSIKIEGMINPSDLLACEENHCLYVTDDAPHPGFKMREPPTAGCLWRIQLDGEQKHDRLLLSEKDWRPRALSRTLNGNILITTKHDDRRIYICDLNGQQLKKLYLPKAVFDPEHIIEGLHEEFIVCHRVHKGDNSMPLIVRLKIDPKDEKRLMFAENPRLRDDLHLDRPEHMVRLQDGRIIVADFYKDRVLILTGDLKLQEILLQSTEDDRSIDRPCRLSYDAQNCELLVAFHHTADLFKLTVCPAVKN